MSEIVRIVKIRTEGIFSGPFITTYHIAFTGKYNAAGQRLYKVRRDGKLITRGHKYAVGNDHDDIVRQLLRPNDWQLSRELVAEPAGA